MFDRRPEPLPIENRTDFDTARTPSGRAVRLLRAASPVVPTRSPRSLHRSALYTVIPGSVDSSVNRYFLSIRYRVNQS